MTAKPQPRVTARDLVAALERRFPSPEYVLLEQVRGATGFAAGADRSADAIAMSVWPSRGLELHGFEVKVSRGDWLRELREPAKAEAIAGYCHFWWLVTVAGVVRADELPAGWGLLVLGAAQDLFKPNSKLSLQPLKQAPAREPRPLDYSFLASVLRNVVKRETDGGRLARAAAVARREGVAEGMRRGARDDLQRLRNAAEHIIGRAKLAALELDAATERAGAAAAAGASGEVEKEEVPHPDSEGDPA